MHGGFAACKVNLLHTRCFEQGHASFGIGERFHMGRLGGVEAETYGQVRYNSSDYRWSIQELCTTGVVTYACQVIIHRKRDFPWEGCEAVKMMDYEKQPYQSKEEHNVMHVVYVEHV